MEYVISAAGDESYRMRKNVAEEWEIRSIVSGNVIWRADDVTNEGLSFDEALELAEYDGFELVGVVTPA